MTRREKPVQPKPKPEPEPEEVVAAAKAAFETAVPGVGVCDRCGQLATRGHRCEVPDA